MTFVETESIIWALMKLQLYNYELLTINRRSLCLSVCLSFDFLTTIHPIGFIVGGCIARVPRKCSAECEVVWMSSSRESCKQQYKRPSNQPIPNRHALPSTALVQLNWTHTTILVNLDLSHAFYCVMGSSDLLVNVSDPESVSSNGSRIKRRMAELKNVTKATTGAQEENYQQKSAEKVEMNRNYVWQYLTNPGETGWIWTEFKPTLLSDRNL